MANLGGLKSFGLDRMAKPQSDRLSYKRKIQERRRPSGERAKIHRAAMFDMLGVKHSYVE